MSEAVTPVRLALALLVLVVPASADEFGMALAELGDIDGRGLPDLLIGDPPERNRRWNTGRRGQVYLVAGEDGRLIYRVTGPDSVERFGATVAALGDVNGDCVPDFVVGCPRAGAKALGYVRVFSGANGRALYTLGVPRDEYKYEWCSVSSGPALCSLGDVDGDGAADFAVGSALHGESREPSGIVRLYSGVDGELVREWVGEEGDRFGLSLARLGDLDGDGVDELAAGSACFGLGAGYVRILSPRSGELLLDVRDPQGARGFGFSLSACGDLDEDGVSDLFIGAPSPSTMTRGVPGHRPFVRAVSGADGSTIREWERRAHSRFGAVVLALPDLDGDSTPELAVSAATAMDRTCWVLRGSADLVLHDLEPDLMAESNLGVSMARLSDLDGDGVSDFAVGAPTWRGTFGGRVRIVSGRSGDAIRFVHRGNMIRIQ